MPIAVPLAIAGASVAGAAISSSASRSAARTQSQATDRAADLQNQQFQQLLRLQMPGYNRGEQAAGMYMQALGFPAQQSQGYGGSTITGQGMPGGMMTGGGAGMARRLAGVTGQDYAEGPQGALNINEPQINPGQPGGQPGGQAPMDIGAIVRATPGYQEQMQDGMTAIDRAAPLRGGMYSGRRMKALNDYGQRTFGGYYENWLNRVGGIAGQQSQTAQNIGQAGMQNANNVGNLMMTGANARAQGSLNSASAWGGALGNIGGMIGGYYG